MAAERLSIGIVTPTLSRSGGGIFPIVRAHARGLNALPGAQTTLYGLWDAAADEDARSLLPVVARKHVPVLRRFGYAPALPADLLRGNHHVLHQHGLWLYPSVAVNGWRRRTGRPTVISTQGMLEPWAVANSALKKRLAAAAFERSNLHHAACIHCSAAEVKGVRDFGLTNPIAVIANGIELPADADRPARPQWLPGDGKRTLLFLGRLHPKKGVGELLNAWALLRGRHPALAGAWRLAIAGWDDGGHAEGLRSLAARLAIPGNELVFPGALFGVDKAAALAHADAFILPSYSEGFPMTALEAWSYRLPVLMTRECNIPAGFTTGAAIEITNPPQELAQSLAAILARTDLGKIGARGRALVEERFAWDAIVADLMAVYEWLAGRASVPPSVRMD